MRHGKKINHLGRKTAHRKSMLANMACSLIEHKRINTTTAKAKALKQFVEPLITKSKSDTTQNRKLVFSRLRQKEAVAELFRDISAKIGTGVAELLDKGYTYREVKTMTGVSLTTIGRVARYLFDGSNGYKTALRRIKNND